MITCYPHCAEGTGAAPPAAAMKMKQALGHKKAGLPLCGGNVDHDQFAHILTLQPA